MPTLLRLALWLRFWRRFGDGVCAAACRSALVLLAFWRRFGDGVCAAAYGKTLL